MSEGRKACAQRSPYAVSHGGSIRESCERSRDDSDLEKMKGPIVTTMRMNFSSMVLGEVVYLWPDIRERLTLNSIAQAFGKDERASSFLL